MTAPHSRFVPACRDAGEAVEEAGVAVRAAARPAGQLSARDAVAACGVSVAAVVRRAPFRVPCRVRLADVASGQVRSYVGETVEVSATAAVIRLACEPEVGMWVETLVPHVNGDPLLLWGTVTNVRRTLSYTYEVDVELAESGPALSS